MAACLAGGLALLVAGCKTTTQSDKFVAEGYAAQPKTVFAAYYLQNDPVLLDNRRLEERVAAGLSRCGAQSRSVMLTNVSYGGFPAEYANSTTEDVDAILVLSEASSGMAKFAEAMMGGRRGETGRNYSVALFDRKTMTRVWGAEVNVHGSSAIQVYSAQEKTDHFARDLLGYLSADGILSCPKEAG